MIKKGNEKRKAHRGITKLHAYPARKHPHNCGAAPKSGHAVTARGNRVPDAVAAPPARENRTVNRAAPSRVNRARSTREPGGDHVPPHA